MEIEIISVNFPFLTFKGQNGEEVEGYYSQPSLFGWLKHQELPIKAIVKKEFLVFPIKQIKNGECYTRTGFRQIAVRYINRNYELTPIVYKLNWGYESERATFQVALKGEYILRVNWGHGADGSLIQICKLDENLNCIPVSQQEYENIINWLETKPRFKGFLSPDTRGRSFLDGYLY